MAEPDIHSKLGENRISEDHNSRLNRLVRRWSELYFASLLDVWNEPINFVLTTPKLNAWSYFIVGTCPADNYSSSRQPRMFQLFNPFNLKLSLLKPRKYQLDLSQSFFVLSVFHPRTFGFFLCPIFFVCPSGPTWMSIIKFRTICFGNSAEFQKSIFDWSLFCSGMMYLRSNISSLMHTLNYLSMLSFNLLLHISIKMEPPTVPVVDLRAAFFESETYSFKFSQMHFFCPRWFCLLLHFC